MKSAADLIVSISLLFGAGYLSIKTIEKFEAMAKLKVQQGLPHLSPFTSKLTGITYDDRTGEPRIVNSRNTQK